MTVLALPDPQTLAAAQAPALVEHVRELREHLGRREHKPDLWLIEPGVYLDVKTTSTDNLAIEVDCFRAWDALEHDGWDVLVAYRNRAGVWRIDDHRSLQARIRFVRPPTYNGSNDRWYLIATDSAATIDQWFA